MSRMVYRLSSIFLSTPSARRATAEAAAETLERLISIHALREEGDDTSVKAKSIVYTISIHALREEGDGLPTGVKNKIKVFLSTPSARRATQGFSAEYPWSPYFYPRPPRGGRPRIFSRISMVSLFLSTPSARRATSRAQLPAGTGNHFYPRPPRGGRHAKSTIRLETGRDFYPRPPRGGRHFEVFCKLRVAVFLSTPSARRATLWEKLKKNRGCQHFYPRPPRGGRPCRF